MGMSHEDRQWLEGRLNAVKQELREDNRAMEGRLVMRLQDIEGMTTKRLDDHSDRIRALERWRSWVVGSAGAAGLALGRFWDSLTGRGGP